MQEGDSPECVPIRESDVQCRYACAHDSRCHVYVFTGLCFRYLFKYCVVLGVDKFRVNLSQLLAL